MRRTKRERNRNEGGREGGCVGGRGNSTMLGENNRHIHNGTFHYGAK